MKVNPRPKIYFDDVVAAMWHEFEEHAQQIDDILMCFGEASLQVNFPKSALCWKALAQIGFMMLAEEHKLLEERMQGVLDAALLKNKKEARMHAAIVGFLRNHIKNCEELLALLNRLAKKNILFQQKDDEINLLIMSKKLVAKSILLVSLRPDKLFILHPDASDYKIGVQLAQCGLTVGLFLKNLTDTRMKHPVMHEELLATDKELKHFKNIVKGEEILMHADYENLAHSTVYSNNRVNRTMHRINDYFGARW